MFPPFFRDAVLGVPRHIEVAGFPSRPARFHAATQQVPQ